MTTDSTNILLVAMLGMFCLAIMVAVFVLVYQRRLLIQKQALQTANIKHQTELLRATIKSQEVERDRIGRDLHDEVGMMLSTIKLHLTRNQSDEAHLQYLLDDVIDSVRTISTELKPVVLESLGLTESIKDMLSKVSRSGDFEVSFINEYVGGVPKLNELMLYRIVQELLSNSIKHSKGSEIHISLIDDNGVLKMIYLDNGTGFENNESEGHRRGLGMKNIESRVNILGGDLSISGESGFKAVIRLPKITEEHG